jgi:hypothetical protein
MDTLMYGTIDAISEIWAKSDRLDLVKVLNDFVRYAEHGRGVVINVGAFLEKIKVDTPDAYLEVKELADRYFDIVEEYKRL